MSGLILPAAIFLMVALWGVFSAGRKFRKEFNRRGIAWDQAAPAVLNGAGFLVVDVVYGPPRGLGHPVIWLITTEEAAQEDLTRTLETSARLVRCPRALRSYEALSRQVPAAQVRSHGWDIHAGLASASR